MSLVGMLLEPTEAVVEGVRRRTLRRRWAATAVRKQSSRELPVPDCKVKAPAHGHNKNDKSILPRDFHAKVRAEAID